MFNPRNHRSSQIASSHTINSASSPAASLETSQSASGSNLSGVMATSPETTGSRTMGSAFGSESSKRPLDYKKFPSLVRETILLYWVFDLTETGLPATDCKNTLPALIKALRPESACYLQALKLYYEHASFHLGQDNWSFAENMPPNIWRSIRKLHM